jgi:hypothetical protein
VDVSFLTPPPQNKNKKRLAFFLPIDNPACAHLMEIAYDDGGRKSVLIVTLRVKELL